MKTRLFFKIYSSLLFVSFFLIGTSANGELIEDDRQLDQSVQYPIVLHETIDPISLMEFQSQDVKTVQENLAVLEKTIEKFASKTFVPYIWGGNRVGTIAECNSCVACLQKRATENLIVGGENVAENRSSIASKGQTSCESCDRCGIDCSNLAHTVYAEAKLEFPYLTSRSMAGDENRQLEDKYNLVEIGHDLREAKFGDLIVQESHVVIFLGFPSSDLSNVSYLHSSRRGEDERPFGGINVVRGRSRESFQKTVVRILRHRQLLEPQVYSDRVVTNDQLKVLVN